TSFFGIGTALSLAIAGLLAPHYGWRSAFVVSAAGPVIAAALVLGLQPMQPASAKAFRLSALFPVRSWRKVMQDRASSGYMLGYAVHCLELFGSRAWMVAFLVYSA